MHIIFKADMPYSAGRCIIHAMNSKRKASREKRTNHYNVLAVYYLRDFAGRDMFVGTLDEMSNKMNWHLDTVRPGKFFTERELVNEDGEPFDGYILSMPGTDDAMKRIAASRTPTVLVNITDRQLSARSDAVASVWTDNADIGLCLPWRGILGPGHTPR